jgi:kinesin family protein 1
LRRINDHESFVYTARVSGSNSEDVYDPKVPPEKQKVTYKTKDGRIKTVTKAELQEQMEASEKLMQSLNETWEEKMQRTQEVQKEREKALEELGITVEKNLVGVHTPKKVRRLNFFAFRWFNAGSAY